MNREYEPFPSPEDVQERTVHKKPAGIIIIEEFIAMDTSHIDTVDGLSEETERVRQALNALITLKGDELRISGGSTLTKGVLECYELERILPGDGETLFMRTDGERMRIERRKNHVLMTRNGSQEDDHDLQYLLKFPVESSFTEATEFEAVYAMWRNNPGSVREKVDVYLPTSDPDNPNLQQGFAYVLKQSLNDLQSVI